MFEELKKELNSIAGNWNGDDDSIAEDRTHASNEALEKIEQLEELLTELNICQK